MQTQLHNASSIFHARSVAVVGASTNPEKVGYLILDNLIESGYTGQLYPINPNASELLGMTAYPTLAALPEPPELVVVAVPAAMVPDTLAQAAAVGAKGSVVVSGGFREAGRYDLEAQIRQIVQETGIRVVGPNCQGINYRPNLLCASWPLMTLRGPIAVISQSGTVASAMAGWAVDDRLGIAATVSLGNQVDLCETDFIEFFADDPDTSVISLYIEGVKNGARFMDVARRTTPHKPIVILKSGRTPGGQKAAASHTKSLAGSDVVFDAACRQTGIVRAPDLESLYDYTKALAMMSPPKGNRLFFVTSSGGSGILAIDEAEKHGLMVPALPDDAKAGLKQATLPATTIYSNPFDLTMSTAADYREAVVTAARFDVGDVFLIVFGDPIPGASEVIQSLLPVCRASIAVAFLGGAEIEKAETPKIQALGVPVFPTPERAVRAIAAAVQWSNRARNTVL